MKLIFVEKILSYKIIAAASPTASRRARARISYSERAFHMYSKHSPLSQDANFISASRLSLSLSHPNIFELASREILEINDDVVEGTSDAF